MIRTFLGAIFALVTTLQLATAQQNSNDLVWVQIEAQNGLSQVTDALRRRSAQLEDVNGFDLGGGWFGVALGPYTRTDAEQVLRVLRSEGRIPRDSYVAASSDYRRQIWPVGSDTLTSLQAATPAITADDGADGNDSSAVADQQDVATASDADTTTVVETTPTFVDETVREARASERLLTRDERADLQIALKWAGFYTARIDASFGAGTRRSMAAWQEANGFDNTGVLTTYQRAELLNQYNSVLEGLDLQLVSDPETGIEMKMPMGVVKFSKFEPPFAHYDATGDIPATVLLISQEGTQDTLFGLYDIMQTLKIVPLDGPRERKKDSFLLIGEGATMISHTVATLKNGQIKGFTLVWPAGDEERRTRLLAEMQDSFARIDGVLDPAAGYNDAQSIDLVSGLEIRKPMLSRSGFYVDGSGVVVTTSQVLQSCGHVTIDDEYEADVVLVDDAQGIAILRPRDALAPMNVASFQQTTPRLKSNIAVAGFSFGGILGAPSLTYGEIADLKGLNGEDGMKRLVLSALDGDAGGPVFDAGGAVLGMLLPGGDKGRQLPEGVSFAANAGAVQAALQQAGVAVASTSELTQISPASLSDAASGMTVLVSCWE